MTCEPLGFFFSKGHLAFGIMKIALVSWILVVGDDNCIDHRQTNKQTDS